MTRVGKYMVYNPEGGKPQKYYNSYYEAVGDAQILNDKEKTDILILEVVGKVETEKTTLYRDKVIEGTREVILI